MKRLIVLALVLMLLPSASAAIGTLKVENPELSTSADFPRPMLEKGLPPEFTAFTEYAPSPEADLSAKIAVAEMAIDVQTKQLGIGSLTPPPRVGLPLPSVIIEDLMDLYGYDPTPSDQVAIDSLDALEPGTRDPLSRILRSQLSIESAFAEATPTVDPSATIGSGGGQNGFVDTWSQTGIDLAQVMRSRIDILEATVDLKEHAASSNSQVVDVPPVLRVDLGEGDREYDTDYIILIEGGGDDHYLNNAGGAGFIIPELGITDPCELSREGPPYTALLIDLKGNDTYGDPTFPPSERRGCGVNGGSFSWGHGFLVDTQGDDTYAAGTNSVNGGASFLALGFLFDAAGDDLYHTGSTATNGGGAWTYGVGLLVDGGGNDTFNAGDTGTNGGGLQGAGMLVSVSGDDVFSGGDGGTNGGGNFIGIGALINLEGNDVYEAGHGGTNGGADLGRGVLIDRKGDDEYHAADFGTNGGSWAGGVGFILDQEGDDGYFAGNAGTNGGGAFNGIGFLWDEEGDDRYESGSNGVNGGGFFAGSGTLFDGAGNDTYIAHGDGANGGADQAAGLLFDDGGKDQYRDLLVDCWDCTVIPKGTAGAQADQ